MVAVVVVALRGPLSDNVGVAEQGLKAIRHLALGDNNIKLMGAAGACKGEFVSEWVTEASD